MVGNSEDSGDEWDDAGSGPERTVDEFVHHANAVIPGGHFRLIYRHPAGWLKFGAYIQYREFEHPLGLRVGGDHVLAAREQQVILENFQLEEFLGLFGLDRLVD